MLMNGDGDGSITMIVCRSCNSLQEMQGLASSLQVDNTFLDHGRGDLSDSENFCHVFTAPEMSLFQKITNYEMFHFSEYQVFCTNLHILKPQRGIEPKYIFLVQF